MSTAELTASDTSEWKMPSTRKAGMICLIITESALFSIFVVAYLFYMGKSLNPPYAHQTLTAFPYGGSVALFGSSLIIWFAEKALHKGNKLWFQIWWGITFLMGAYFLYFTATEWREFIVEKHLTLQSNVFGTTFYSLVGLHASHVVIGLILLGLVWVLNLFNKIPADHHEHVEMVSWYWHFVDAIWLVVVTVVYIISAHTNVNF